MKRFLGALLKPFRSQKRIHLDYASATPVHGDVFRAMRPYFSAEWANPGAIHTEGVRARKAVEDARKRIARTLKVRTEDIIFTGGGTEANNLAIIGFAEQRHTEGIAYEHMEIISTRIEHPSVLEGLHFLEAKGVRIVYAPVNERGLIELHILQTLFSKQTVLVTCAYVNSEVGVVQDIKKITRTVRAWNTAQAAQVRTHVDASQAPLWLSCAVDMLGVDMLTLDAGKCYGPKGVGVLVRRHGVLLKPITFGGGQEGGIRSGTENVPLIVGCAYALVSAQEYHAKRAQRATEIQKHLLALLKEHLPNSVVNGDLDARVPNNINISLPGHDSEYAVLWLDARGIAASTKSACGVGKGNGSDVVREMTHDEARALSTIRFTFGEETKKSDVEHAVKALVHFCALTGRNIDSANT